MGGGLGRCLGAQGGEQWGAVEGSQERGVRVAPVQPQGGSTTDGSVGGRVQEVGAVPVEEVGGVVVQEWQARGEALGGARVGGVGSQDRLQQGAQRGRKGGGCGGAGVVGGVFQQGLQGVGGGRKRGGVGVVGGGGVGEGCDQVGEVGQGVVCEGVAEVGVGAPGGGQQGEQGVGGQGQG